MMIKTKLALQRFEETAAHYIHELDQFSLEQLRQKQSENEWSIGQMFQHLISSALYMQLRNLDQCLMPSQDPTVPGTEKTEVGAAIFSQGSFPPTRIHVPPSPQYTPEQPESKEQLIQGLHTVIQRMKDIEPTLEKVSKNIQCPIRDSVDCVRRSGFCLLKCTTVTISCSWTA